MSRLSTHRVPVPDAVGDTPTARKATYRTAVRLDGARQQSAEAWARGCLEGAPGWLRLLLVLGWRRALRLRLGRRDSPSTVLGWYVMDKAPASVTISAGSPLLEAQHHFLSDDDGVVWATLVRTHTRLGQALWRVTAPVHELSMPLLMRRAARRG